MMDPNEGCVECLDEWSDYTMMIVKIIYINSQVFSITVTFQALYFHQRMEILFGP